MKKDDIGYKILFVVIIVLIIIGYREGDKKVKYYEEVQLLTEKVSELESKIDDLETENLRLENYNDELRAIIAEYEGE